MLMSTVARLARNTGREEYSKDTRFSTAIDWIHSREDVQALDILIDANEGYREQAETNYKNVRVQTNNVQFALGVVTGIGLMTLVWLVYELATEAIEFVSLTTAIAAIVIVLAFAVPFVTFTRLYNAAYALGVLEERQKELEAINELFLDDFAEVKIIDLQATLIGQHEVRPTEVQQALAFLVHSYDGCQQA